MTLSPQCAECGGLGMVVVEDAIGHFLKACPMPACRGATSVKLKCILRLARSSAALLEAAEAYEKAASIEMGWLAKGGPVPLQVEHQTIECASNLQSAIARAKEGEL